MKYPKYLNHYVFIVVSFFLVSSNLLYSEVEQKEFIETESLIQKPEEQEQEDELIEDDEKLKQEIFEIISVSYKDIIDLSALYFCGLVDWDKLYDQIITLMHKDFFKILKLFSWYIPAILKNKKVSTFIKIKKSTYVACCLVVFWYISKEVFQEKIVNKGFKIDADTPSFKPRQRPSLNL